MSRANMPAELGNGWLGVPFRLVLAALLAACSTEATLVATTDTAGTGGGVQRASLDIRVAVPDTSDARIASALGSAAGTLRGADVSIIRAGATTALTSRTDEGGVARFTDLLPGQYSVSLSRTVTETELAALPAGDRDLVGFGGGATIQVQAPNTTTSVASYAGRRGSLVFSEIFTYQPRAADGGYYFYGPYFELYNNSDSTIYLDGKLIGLAVRAEFDIPPDYPCSVTARFRLDPQGLWSRYFWTFPGSGRQYPMPPGSTRVVATDAIDHRSFADGLLDLRSADFEFIGRQDVDNPQVPNMLNTGPGALWSVNQTHGFNGSSLAMVLYVADAVPLESMATATVFQGDLASEGEHRLVPADKVLDVFNALWTPEIASSVSTANAECVESTNIRFDRQKARILDIGPSTSIQRRVLRAPPGGRVLLQRTLTSARDFVRGGAPTPGTVP